ncbi:MAG: gas vesicle protein K [Chloroflexi bacterium]|nr:gas vesicle protein K [Chloroflexota bacterium]
MINNEESITHNEKLLSDPEDLQAFASELEHCNPTLPRKISVDPEGVEKGLAKLVLTVIELLRQLMEKQALHRIDAGSLSEEEIERLGETFMKLDSRMEELKLIFGLEKEELNLNLGPLGDLL